MPENPDIDAVADAVLERLDPGTVIDNKIILSKRQLLAIAGSGLGAGGLAALGISEASAEGAAGQVGTDTEPVDVEAWDLNVQNGATFNGSDVKGVGVMDVEEATIENLASKLSLTGSDQDIVDSANTQVEWDTIEFEDADIVEVDLENNKMTVRRSGTYFVTASVRWEPGNFSDGDEIQLSLIDPNNRDSIGEKIHPGNNRITQEKTQIMKLDDGQDIIIEVWHNSGAEETIDSNGTRTQFGVGRLG